MATRIWKHSVCFTILWTLLCSSPALAQKGKGGGGGGSGKEEAPAITYKWVSLGTEGAIQITERGDIRCYNGLLKLADTAGNLQEVDVVNHLITEGFLGPRLDMDALSAAYDAGEIRLEDITGTEGLSHWHINESREIVGYAWVWDQGVTSELCFYYRPGNQDFTPSSDSVFAVLFKKPASYNITKIVINNHGLVAGVASDPDNPTAGRQLFLWSTKYLDADPLWVGTSGLDVNSGQNDTVDAINDSGIILGSHRGIVEYAWQFSLETGFVGVQAGSGLLDGYARDMNQFGEVVGSAATSDPFSSAYNYQAFRMSLDGSLELVNLTRSGKSFARAVNSAGDLLGTGDMSRDNNVWRPFVFTKAGTLIDVLSNTVSLPPVLSDSTTWGYVEPYDMNDQGVIVGSAVAGTGGGFMLVPQN